MGADERHAPYATNRPEEVGSFRHIVGVQYGSWARDMDDHSDDIQAIAAVIRRQFGSLNWTPETTGDWATFAADFAPGASLYPAARPVRPQTPQDFIARMQGVAATSLRSFKEAALGSRIHVFGNVAVAAAACEMTENDARVNRGVEMLLLIKSDGAWKIVAQAWDTENESRRIPADLLSGDR